jgi:pimeloyl-ACP methyl ester carboxylesterase
VQTWEVEPASFERASKLRAPDVGVRVRGGVVALHGSALPQRDQPIFEHLAAAVTPMGFAVLSFDRRPWPDGADTPIAVQAEDALSAVEFLRARIDAPVGLFGFSQGAWSASLAAARDRTVAFLALVGCSGVSPAEQMRFYTDELLRRAGYGNAERDHLRELRLAVEALHRGAGDRESAAVFRDRHDPPTSANITAVAGVGFWSTHRSPSAPPDAVQRHRKAPRESDSHRARHATLAAEPCGSIGRRVVVLGPADRLR